MNAAPTPVLRFGFLCASYRSRYGGAELAVRRLGEELLKQGHEVTVVCAEGPSAAPGEERLRVKTLARDRRRERRVQRLLSLERMRGGYRLSQWLFRSGYHRLLGLGPWCPELLDPDLYRDFDVVLLFHYGNAWPALFPRVAGSLSGVVKAAYPFFHVQEPVSSHGAILPKLYRCFDVMVTATDYEAAWLRQHGWRNRCFATLGVGSDPCPHSPTKGSFRRRHQVPVGVPLILFVGRKIHNKGVMHLVEAMPQVWRRHPDTHLALLGFAHNDPAWLGDGLARLGDEGASRVLNLDDVTDAEREAALADCDVFAMPSISDSFGIAYLDAWRHQKPVIGCRGMSSESLIDDGLDGLLVHFGAVDELGKALVRLLDSERERDEMGRHGYEKWSERFRWGQVAERASALFADKVKYKQQ